MNKEMQLFDSHKERISKRFIEVREKLGLGPTELAKRANLHQSQVSEIEKGTRNITAEILLKLEIAFNINWRFIGRGEGEMFLPEPNSMAGEPTATYNTSNGNSIMWKEKYYTLVEKHAVLSEKYTSLLEERVIHDKSDKRHTG